MRNLCNVFRYVVTLLPLFLLACGGGGGGGGASTVASAGTGTVTLLVTDGPSEDFNAINLTVVKAELLSDSGKVTLFSGQKTFDLLRLADVTEIFSVTHVPVGTYNKIRLTLTSVELVMKDGSKAYPKLPGNGKLDLNPRSSFVVIGGATILIQLDMDAEKSIHVVSAGNSDSYQFRPVVFVDIVTDEFDTKLVQLRGTVDNLDTLEGTFDLCEIRVQGLLLDDDEEDGKFYCVRVDAAQVPASFFDTNGDPADINSLENGAIATATGRFAFNGTTLASSKNNKNDDDGSSDDSSRDDDSSDDDDYRDLILVAEVVWPGDFAEVNGIARSAVITDTDTGTWFEFEVLEGQGYVFDAPIPTILQEGTRLFNSKGLPVDESVIQDGVSARVNGVFQAGLDELKAALVILDIEASQSQLIGTIGAVADDFSSMALLTDSGDRCVLIDTGSGGTQVFETSLDDDDTIQFDQKEASDLRSGYTANVFGYTDITGCLDAETIIYEVEVAFIPEQPLP